MKHFNLSRTYGLDAAIAYVRQLAEEQETIQVGIAPQKFSSSQSAYFHVIVKLWGFELGYYPPEAKQHVKEDVCPDIFEIQGRKKKYWRSWSELTKTEANQVIKRLRAFAADQGIYLPEPNETEKILALQEWAAKRGF